MNHRHRSSAALILFELVTDYAKAVSALLEGDVDETACDDALQEILAFVKEVQNGEEDEQD